LAVPVVHAAQKVTEHRGRQHRPRRQAEHPQQTPRDRHFAAMICDPLNHPTQVSALHLVEVVYSVAKANRRFGPANEPRTIEPPERRAYVFN